VSGIDGIVIVKGEATRNWNAHRAVLHTVAAGGAGYGGGTLDDGSGKERIVASGIAKWYKPDELVGHTVIVVANLKPAVLCGVESNGMILAADCGEDDVKLIFADDIPAGSKVR